MGRTSQDEKYRYSQQYAPETGLRYNIHRYYDPAQGRYISPDPLGVPDGNDRYAYVKGTRAMTGYYGGGTTSADLPASYAKALADSAASTRIEILSPTKETCSKSGLPGIPTAKQIPLAGRLML
ncbi:MAG: RHS repeat-associated core domain-containing protein [Burkholderiales bacterium]|nr:RHS repeat-associated core domain-containing protein [Burkholderiales bacterium]